MEVYELRNNVQLSAREHNDELQVLSALRGKGKGGDRMTQKERLVELLEIHGMRHITAESCATMLLDEGVIVPPCKVGRSCMVC